MHTSTLETAIIGGGKTEAMGQITCRKRVQIIAELGKCSSKRVRCSQYGGANRVVHSSMTTPDIEAEIVERALRTCCTVPQRKARTLRRPAVFFNDGAEPVGSVRKSSCLACISRRPQSSKGQCAHSRGENWRNLLEKWNRQSPAAKQEQHLQWSNDELRSRHRPKSQYARQMDLQRGATMARLQRAEVHWSLFAEQSRFRWKPNLSFSKPRNGYFL